MALKRVEIWWALEHSTPGNLGRQQVAINAAIVLLDSGNSESARALMREFSSDLAGECQNECLKIWHIKVRLLFVTHL